MVGVIVGRVVVVEGVGKGVVEEVAAVGRRQVLRWSQRGWVGDSPTGWKWHEMEWVGRSWLGLWSVDGRERVRRTFVEDLELSQLLRHDAG